MNGPARFLALVALVPAAANPALLVREGSLTLSLCEGGSISIPAGKQLPGSRDNACCNKGCHSGEKRKRGQSDSRDGEPERP